MVSPVLNPKQTQEAQILSSKLKDIRQRKKAYVDFTGALYVVDYLQNLNIRANIQKSVFKCSKLYADFEIVDIYCNSHMIYVLTTYESNYVKIPTSHLEQDILPEFYVAVDVKRGLKQAEIKGVIYKDEIKSMQKEGKYFRININNLKDSKEAFLGLKKYGGMKPSVGRHLDCMKLFVDYVDNKLDEDSKKKLIGHILTCETCKKRLIETIEFDSCAKTALNHENILSKEDVSTKDNFMKRLELTTSENSAQLKGAIDVIYKGEELSKLKADAFKYKGADIPSKTKKLIIATTTIVIIFFVLVIFAFNLPPKQVSKPPKNVQGAVIQDNSYNENSAADFDINIPKIKKQTGYTTVSKVSWEVSSKNTDDNQKKFLQQAGKSIRLNLQNDLLLTDAAIVNNEVKFDIKFLRDGNLDTISIAKSTGSEAVDEVIKQSIENTLYYMRPPKGAFSGRKNGLTLVVNF